MVMGKKKKGTPRISILQTEEHRKGNKLKKKKKIRPRNQKREVREKRYILSKPEKVETKRPRTQ